MDHIVEQMLSQHRSGTLDMWSKDFFQSITNNLTSESGTG